MVFGRFHITILTDGDVVLTRRGALCRGPARASRMWCTEQLQAALAAARGRRGEDAICEIRALIWAIEQLRQRADPDGK
jgi:hypothetical protein